MKNGVSIFGLSTEELSKNGKKGGKRAYEMKVGAHGRTKEEMSEIEKDKTKLFKDLSQKNKQQNEIETLTKKQEDMESTLLEKSN